VPLAEKVKNAGKMPALRLNGLAFGDSSDPALKKDCVRGGIVYCMSFEPEDGTPGSEP
jgi:hypothetical protein